MGVKEYKPTTPGRRFGTVSDFSEVTRGRPEKTLVRRVSRRGGRNFQGKITARHRGGGARKLLRVIDFKRDKRDVPAKVAAVEYDPNRSARIALLHYADGEKRYILAPKGLAVGDSIVAGERVEPKTGNAMPLRNIPLGLEVHAVELTPGMGARLARSAGSYVILSAREGDYAMLILPSKEMRKVHVDCIATIGQVGNAEHNTISIGKAGRNRWKGWRPYVRGTAQNPVSHPMGGGEGRTGGGRHPCSPTGLLSKGGKTRKRRNRSSKFILRRAKGKK
ncbi:MAG: 50S ribosomal protein L2 [Planctomycetota bacterium]